MNNYEKISGWFNFEDLYDNIAKTCKDGAILVEVRCWLGKSTSFLAEKLLLYEKKVTLYAVDTWEGSDEEVHKKYIDSIGGKDNLYNEFLSNMSNIKDISSILKTVRKPSIEAAKLFEDKSVDFCYIDAGHTYEDVNADIKAWLPKIKPGGIIAGHDYNLDNPAAKGLCIAVQEHFKNDFRVSINSWIYEVK